MGSVKTDEAELKLTMTVSFSYISTVSLFPSPCIQGGCASENPNMTRSCAPALVAFLFPVLSALSPVMYLAA